MSYLHFDLWLKYVREELKTHEGLLMFEELDMPSLKDGWRDGNAKEFAEWIEEEVKKEKEKKNG